MTRRLLVTLVVGLLLFITACAPQTPPTPPNPPNTDQPPVDPPPQNNQNPSENELPNIGGIALGDDIGKVSSILTSTYTDTTSEEEGYYGPHYVREYEQGVTLVVNQETDEILQVFSSDPNLATDLGVKIGEDYDTVVEKYKNDYEAPVSRHSDEELIGWFQTEDEELVIFDLDEDASSMFNPEVKSDSQVHRIILAHMRYMD